MEDKLGRVRLEIRLEWTFQLLVRSGGRVNHQRLGIAHIGQMRGQLHIVNELGMDKVGSGEVRTDLGSCLRVRWIRLGG